MKYVMLSFLTLLFLLQVPVAAQDLDPHAADELSHPLQPPDTSSPRSTLYGFIADTNRFADMVRQLGRGNLDGSKRLVINRRIRRYLDLSEVPDHIRGQAAVDTALQLKEILDRIEIPPIGEVPGAEDEELPDRWRLPGSDIVIERIQEGHFAGEFCFSAQTVAEIEDMYKSARQLPYRTDGPYRTEGLLEWHRTEPQSPFMNRLLRHTPEFLRSRNGGGHALWQWVGLVISTISGLLLMRLVYRVGRKRAEHFQEGHIWRYMITLTFPLVAVLIPLGLKAIIRNYLNLHGTLLTVMDFLLGVLILLGIMRLVWAIGNRILAVVINHRGLEEHQLDMQMLRLAGRVITVLAVMVVFLEGGKRLGIPVTTLVAGAGIGGFAVAMAAQDSLKNILGSLMLVLDKPFDVGDRILVEGFDGVVKEIGLRSTKLELMTGHGATIPNEKVAQTRIENISRRPFIRRILDLKLPLNTPSDRTERVVSKLEAGLQDHEGMPEGFPPRVFFFDYSDDAYVIRIIYWYGPPKYWDYLTFNQNINLLFLRILEEEGVPLRLPVRVVQTDLEGQGPIDATGSMFPGETS